jgi:hypothetical protein
MFRGRVHTSSKKFFLITAPGGAMSNRILWKKQVFNQDPTQDDWREMLRDVPRGTASILLWRIYEHKNALHLQVPLFAFCELYDECRRILNTHFEMRKDPYKVLQKRGQYHVKVARPA